MNFNQYKVRKRNQQRTIRKRNDNTTLTQILIEYLFDVGQITEDYSPEMIKSIAELYKELGTRN